MGKGGPGGNIDVNRCFPTDTASVKVCFFQKGGHDRGLEPCIW